MGDAFPFFAALAALGLGIDLAARGFAAARAGLLGFVLAVGASAFFFGDLMEDPSADFFRARVAAEAAFLADFFAGFWVLFFVVFFFETGDFALDADRECSERPAAEGEALCFKR